MISAEVARLSWSRQANKQSAQVKFDLMLDESQSSMWDSCEDCVDLYDVGAFLSQDVGIGPAICSWVFGPKVWT